MVFSLMIDQREPPWVQGLRFNGASVAVTLLDAGDLLIACEDCLLGIERKTTDDLLSSLADNRLFAQLARLRGLTPWAYLVVTGTLQPGPGGTAVSGGRDTGWSWASVQGGLLTAQEIGVHVVFAAGDLDYEATILRLCNHDRGPLRIAPTRASVALSEAEAILTALPGIGTEKAAALLDYCGTAAWALTYLSDDRCETRNAPGIGPATKQRIRRALGLEDWAVLHVVDREGTPRTFEQKERVV
jgi:ERCC4-type nuclease